MPGVHQLTRLTHTLSRTIPAGAVDGKSPYRGARLTSYNQRLLQLLQLPRRCPSSASDSSSPIPDRADVTSAPAWPCIVSPCPWFPMYQPRASNALLGSEQNRGRGPRMKGLKGGASPRHREILPGLGSLEENVSGWAVGLLSLNLSMRKGSELGWHPGRSRQWGRGLGALTRSAAGDQTNPLARHAASFTWSAHRIR